MSGQARAARARRRNEEEGMRVSIKSLAQDTFKFLLLLRQAQPNPTQPCSTRLSSVLFKDNYTILTPDRPHKKSWKISLLWSHGWMQTKASDEWVWGVRSETTSPKNERAYWTRSRSFVSFHSASTRLDCFVVDFLRLAGDKILTSCQ